MNLTKQQTIIEHRKMWNWIAEQIKDEKCELITEMKVKYLKNNFGEPILCDCFLCDYHENLFGESDFSCSKCIVDWEISKACEGNSSSYYQQLSKKQRDYRCRIIYDCLLSKEKEKELLKERIFLAEKIRDLKEKRDV